MKNKNRRNLPVRHSGLRPPIRVAVTHQMRAQFVRRFNSAVQSTIVELKTNYPSQFKEHRIEKRIRRSIVPDLLNSINLVCDKANNAAVNASNQHESIEVWFQRQYSRALGKAIAPRNMTEWVHGNQSALEGFMHEFDRVLRDKLREQALI